MKRRVDAELTGQLYMQAPKGIMATIVNAIILVFILRNAILRSTLMIWLLVTLLTALFRYMLSLNYKRSESKIENADQWSKLLIFNLFLSGAIWGASGIVLFPENAIAYQVFIAFVLAGMVAGATGAFISNVVAFSAFSFPALVPINIHFYMIGDEIHLAMGAMLSLFTIIMFLFAKEIGKTNREFVRLKEYFAEMVEIRTAELQDVNEKLQVEISERIKAEKAAKQSEEKYRLLVENSNDAIFVVQDGRIKFQNQKTGELLGYSMAEMAKIPFRNHIHPDDREMVMERYSKRIKGVDEVSIYSFRVITKAKGELWGEINAVRVPWEGKPAVLCFIRDVTRQKKLENQVQQVKKLESVGILAGGIAHDFNNILTTIVGNISLAKMELNPGNEIYKLLEHSEEAGFRARGLTKQLLTFAKGGTPVKKTTSVEELIRATSEFALRGSNTRCDLKIPRDVWSAEMDEGQINQVIHNLILNADQAMPDGGVIEINVENVVLNASRGLPLKPGKYIKISVKDHGIGIAKDCLPRIFDPYFTTKQKGSGLGLATAYSIVKSHEGHIEAESQLGDGTTFCLYFPASDKPLPRVETEEKRPVVGRGRVLIMDDEEMIRTLGKEMLNRLGYDAESVADGSEAIRYYKDALDAGEPFNVVILDLTVPGAMGGKEAIQYLQEMDPDVKAIVSSGYSSDPIMSEFRGHGFKACISKPYCVEEMSEVLHEVITEGGKLTPLV